MSAEWWDAFPHRYEAVLELNVHSRLPQTRVYYPGARRDGGSDGVWLRITPEGGVPWTGVFASDNLPGRLNLVASWPEPHTVFVAAGGSPYLVDAREPDRWSRIERPALRTFWPAGGRAFLLDDERLSAYDSEGLAWESDPVPGATWLGLLDDEVHLRAENLLHRVNVVHGTTVTEPAPW